jgi:hypothetical protein
MERRRAIAWAGSIALTACVTAIALGSLIGGFGFDVPQPPQAIDPRLAPKSPAETPGLPIETPGRKERPAPDPAQEAAPNDPAPPPEGTAAPPPADPLDTNNYPRVSVDDQKVTAAIPISRLDVTAHSPVVPMRRNDVEKPNIAPGVDKAARPIVNNNRIAGAPGGSPIAGSAGGSPIAGSAGGSPIAGSAGGGRVAGLPCGASRCDVAMADVSKRAPKPTKLSNPIKPSGARDNLGGLRGFHPGAARSSGPRNDAFVPGRWADAGPQAGTVHRRVGGRNDSRDD